jgi:hypothetical protein
MAAAYERVLKQVTTALDMPLPTDTLRVRFYTGWQQGREMTGKSYPFAGDTLIHFWLPSYLGITLMQWYLPHWSSVTPRYDFLRHGMYAAFDASGQNYNAATVNYYNRGEFEPLAQLTVDTAVNSDTERYQTAFAASLVQFILTTYGPEKLKLVYESRVSFPETVRKEFGMSLDQFQSAWLDFARANTLPDELQASADSTNETRK